MATGGYYGITSGNYAAYGSGNDDFFEFLVTDSPINNVTITGGGGNDTIKFSDSNLEGFSATITDFTPNYNLNFSDVPVYTLLYKIQNDGTLLYNVDNNFSVKVLGVTNYYSVTSVASAVTGMDYSYLTTLTTTTANGYVEGGSYDDEITINHRSNRAYGGYGDDTIIANTDGNRLIGDHGNDLFIVKSYANDNTISYGYNDSDGNDTLISAGNYTFIYDPIDSNLFISGGNYNSMFGSSGDTDDFWVYSYNPTGVNVTLQGGSSNSDNITISTGLVGVEGIDAPTATYNSSTNDTINITITDFDSLDNLTIINNNMTAINHNVAADGIHVYDNTGRVQILLANQFNWDAVKGASLTYNDANGHSGTITLENATQLPLTPTGLEINGNYLRVNSNFSGNLLMSNPSINYINEGIVTIDSSANSNNMMIFGNWNANKIISGTGETTLWGGNGGNNTLTGGNGRNHFRYGGNGNDVAENFTSGMANNSDVVVLFDGFSGAVRDGYNVYFNTANGNSIKLQTNTNSSDDAIFYSGDGQTIYTAKIADSSATNITYYDGIDYYGLAQFGTLNLQNGTHDANSHDIRLDGSNGISYLYIANVNAAGSSGNDYLAGNSGNNSIIAGSGETTLWGGNGGDDTLVGGSAKDYFRFTGEGNDVVIDFTSGMANNSDAAILPENFTVSRSNNILTFSAPNGYTMTVNTDSYSGDDAILYSGDGQSFYSAKIADSTATNITYYENIKYYGLAQFGTLNLQNGTHDGNSHDIRLDGSNGVSYLYIANINASGSSGNDTLYGNAGSNEIRAGSGNSTLWGGQYDGTADILIGGDGVDMFLVGKSDGNDEIQNSSYNDVINLYDVSLSEISTSVDENNIYLSLNNGSRITIQNSDNLSSVVWTSDGGQYRYNRSTGWQSA